MKPSSNAAEDWHDDFRWELGPGPSEEDSRWAAENLNGDDEPMPDEAYDSWAAESEAQDRLERGFAG